MCVCPVIIISDEEIFTYVCVCEVCVISILFLKQTKLVNREFLERRKMGAYYEYQLLSSMDSIAQTRYIDHLEKNLKL